VSILSSSKLSSGIDLLSGVRSRRDTDAAGDFEELKPDGADASVAGLQAEIARLQREDDLRYALMLNQLELWRKERSHHTSKLMKALEDLTKK
jgi:hypothetical protein